MKQPQPNIRYACPCSGYLTLDERGGYDICPLCDWEDDGQNDPHADEVWGGPNGDYSLSEARDNFRRHMTMFRPSDRRGFERETREKAIALKRELISLCLELATASNPLSAATLIDRARDLERGLVAATTSED
jgi:hypothetical protein